jgi:hypothetical protein
LLFYKEQGLPTGALRYFNQPGIEAEPVTVGAEVIGWQAKFIDTDLARYKKKKLIEAIDTAKSQHPTLTQLYFYLNVDFGRSTKEGVKDPPYKTEIEEHAKAKGIAITWKTASFFEAPFVCETESPRPARFRGNVDELKSIAARTWARRTAPDRGLLQLRCCVAAACLPCVNRAQRADLLPSPHGRSLRAADSPAWRVDTPQASLH